MLFAVLLYSAVAIPARAPAAPDQQTKPKPHATPKTDSLPAARKAPPPFRIGEKLDYRVSWAGFTSAATVQLAVAERRTLSGWDTWHLRAALHTVNPLRAMFAIDDQFDSYTDTGTLESHQYEMYLDEMGRKQESIIRLLAQGVPARTNTPSVVVAPGTRDPAGAVYSLRVVDWTMTQEFRVPVYDGKKLYELSARLTAPREQVAVPAGTFSASKTDIRLFEGGREVPQTHFTVWLAQDSYRTPVAMQAELPFGSLRVELTRAQQ